MTFLILLPAVFPPSGIFQNSLVSIYFFYLLRRTLVVLKFHGSNFAFLLSSWTLCPTVSLMHLWVYLVDKPTNLTFELLISCLLLSLKLWSGFLAASGISCPFDRGLIPLLLGGNPFDINVRRSDTMHSMVIWVVIRQRFGFFFSFLFPRGMLEADGFSDSTFDIFLFTLMTWQITDDQFPFFSSLSSIENPEGFDSILSFPSSTSINDGETHRAPHSPLPVPRFPDLPRGQSYQSEKFPALLWHRCRCWNWCQCMR